MIERETAYVSILLISFPWDMQIIGYLIILCIEKFPANYLSFEKQLIDSLLTSRNYETQFEFSLCSAFQNLNNELAIILGISLPSWFEMFTDQIMEFFY